MVTWIDAHQLVGNWGEITDLLPRTITSCGFLLEGAKEDHVVLAQSEDGTGSLDSVVAIPVGSVVTIALLCRDEPRC